LKSLEDDAAAKRMLQLIDAKSARIRCYIERLMTFAKRCRTDFDHFYITHGDAGGNIIVSEDKFYIVDWDEPMLAPPERDAWFCMHWSWAMNAFHDALRKSGIEYALQPNRLAYYCYHNFFYYLTESLTAFFDLPDRREALLESVFRFFGGWIKDNLAYADSIE
jgi:thiamine kinase-like enzyme